MCGATANTGSAQLLVAARKLNWRLSPITHGSRGGPATAVGSQHSQVRSPRDDQAGESATLPRCCRR
jgi:hypothetical protein